MSQTSRDLKDGGRAFLYIVLGFIGVFVIIGGIWGGSVLLSNVTGAGGAIKRHNSTNNRISQQAYFEDLAANHPAYVAKIVIAKQHIADAGTAEQKQVDRTNLEGLQQQCIDNAQEFNAASRKYLARDWKSAGLPATLDLQECS